MSLLHSFYCWGHVGVILISTGFFFVFGIENWKILAGLWAIIPLCNAFLCAKIPYAPLLEEGEQEMPVKQLLRQPLFWMFVVLMACAGASEQAVAQWVSAFAERGLGISKTLGDLAGPLFFATMMGLCRLLYGKFSEKLNLQKALLASGVLCIVCYVLIAFSPWPALSLVGCGLCGIAVGILWPGTFSMAAATLRRGATAMFAYLALAGDLGCSLGPTVAGKVAGALGDNLHLGIFAAVVFPVVMIAGVLALRRMKAK
jgi:fucose permease